MNSHAVWKVMVCVRGEDKWVANGLRFDSFEAAREYATVLLSTWSAVAECEVRLDTPVSTVHLVRSDRWVRSKEA